MYNWDRCGRLIRGAVRELELDLAGLSVLTEAATGYYALTPIIAALAGADAVYTLARDSHYASADEAVRSMMALADRFEVADVVQPLSGRDDARVARADVVTNLGFVRPLDAAMLQRLKPTAAIALMFETWEFRPADVDLFAARALGIPVLGTNECHPSLRTIEYVGHVAAKLLYQSDIELLGCRVAVVGDDVFGRAIESVLEAAGANVMFLKARTWSNRQAAFEDALPHLDALVLAEHLDRRPLVAPGSKIDPVHLKTANPGLLLAHVAGGVDEEALRAAGVHITPDHLAPAGSMSVATDFVGPKPMIDLHAAGLRVGSVLARLRLAGHARSSAEAIALQTSLLCQGFAIELENALMRAA